MIAKLGGVVALLLYLPRLHILLQMSQTAPARAAPVANAGDGANESSAQKVFGVVKVSLSPIFNFYRH